MIMTSIYSTKLNAYSSNNKTYLPLGVELFMISVVGEWRACVEQAVFIFQVTVLQLPKPFSLHSNPNQTRVNMFKKANHAVDGVFIVPQASK